MSKEQDEVAKQRAYYRDTAAAYDGAHLATTDEHAIALSWMSALIEQRNICSVLDIGSGLN